MCVEGWLGGVGVCGADRVWIPGGSANRGGSETVEMECEGFRGDEVKVLVFGSWEMDGRGVDWLGGVSEFQIGQFQPCARPCLDLATGSPASWTGSKHVSWAPLLDVRIRRVDIPTIVSKDAWQSSKEWISKK